MIVPNGLAGDSFLARDFMRAFLAMFGLKIRLSIVLGSKMLSIIIQPDHGRGVEASRCVKNATLSASDFILKLLAEKFLLIAW